MLKPGGILVYSTCSFSKKQNENIVENFIYGNVDALSLSLDQNEPKIFMKRFSPLTSGTGGFFIAKIGKRAQQQHVRVSK